MSLSSPLPDPREEAEIDLIKRLFNKGLDAQTISSFTDKPRDQVTHILNIHLKGRIRTPEDEELRAEARKLARQVMAEARIILSMGPMAAKLSVMRSVMPSVTKMIGNVEGESQEEAFQAFQRLLAAQRQTPPPTSPSALDNAIPAHVVSFPDAQPSPPARRTDDPDEETPPGQTRPRRSK